MRVALWLLAHAARGHLVTVARPCDAPVGWEYRCRCGGLRHAL